MGSPTIAAASSNDIWLVEMPVENGNAWQTKHDVSMRDDPLTVRELSCVRTAPRKNSNVF